MLDDIMLFVALVEYGSFKKTAQAMNMQQSTVSKHIAELEYKLGKILLIRDSRNFRLTADGIFIHERFKHLNSYIESTLNNLQHKRKYNLHGEITVSLATVVSYESVSSYIDEFTSEYPDIKLNLLFQSDLPDMASGKTNLAFTYHNIKNNELNCRYMRTESAKLFCKPEYAHQYGLPQQIEDLEKHNLIGGVDMINNTSTDYIKFTNLKTNKEYMFNNLNTNLRANNYFHIKKIGMTTTKYIFGCTASLCNKEVLNGELLPVLPDWETYSMDFYLISRKKVSDIEQKFIDFMYKCMGS